MKIYVTKKGNRLGPYTIKEAQNLRASGQILGSDWAWYEGITDWIPLSQVPGMFSAAPNASMSPPLPAVPQSDSKLLVKRLATAFVLFVIAFVFFFVVIFMVSMMIGGAISGAEASVSQHAKGVEEGTRVGQEAGRKFGEAYSGIIAGAAALASLAISAIVSLWVAFSGLFPWCRAQQNS